MEIKKEQIKKLHDGLEWCEEAQDAIKGAFPDCFEEKEERDITKELRVELDNNLDGNYFIRLYHGDVVVAYTGSNEKGTTEISRKN